MKKTLSIFLIFMSLVASAQVKESIVRMNTVNAPFIEKYIPRQMIRLDSVQYVLTHATLVGQTMKMVFDSGWSYRVGGEAGLVIRVNLAQRDTLAKNLLRDGLYCFVKSNQTLYQYLGYDTLITPSALSNCIFNTYCSCWRSYTDINITWMTNHQPMTAFDSIAKSRMGSCIPDVYLRKYKWIVISHNTDTKMYLGTNDSLSTGIAFDLVNKTGRWNGRLKVSNLVKTGTGGAYLSRGRLSYNADSTLMINAGDTALFMADILSEPLKTGAMSLGWDRLYLPNFHSRTSYIRIGNPTYYNRQSQFVTWEGSIYNTGNPYTPYPAWGGLFIQAGANPWTGLNIYLGMATGNDYLANSNSQRYSGSENVGIGAFVLQRDTSGSYNTAVGSYSLRENITGPYNTAIGYLSLNLNTIGRENVAIGAQSLQKNVVGDSNTAVGVAALFNSLGSRNTAIGYNACIGGTGGMTGTDNVFIGSRCGNELLTASHNVGIGSGTALEFVHANRNVAIGDSSMGSLSTYPSYAQNNVAVGVQALFQSNGDRNIAIGFKAGSEYNLSDRLYIGTGDSANAPLFGNMATKQYWLNGSLTVNDIIVKNNVQIAASPIADVSSSGETMLLLSNIAMNVGDAVYIGSNEKAYLCKADAIANCPYSIAICTETTSGATLTKFLTKGTIRNDSWGWVPGGLIYISTTGTTEHTLTQTAPVGVDNVIMPVAVALSSSVIYFYGNVNSVEHL